MRPAASQRLARLLLALPCAWASLRVVSGPPTVLGLEVAAVPYAFSPAAFALDGPAVLVKASDWTADCPPRYRGKADLKGAILIIDDHPANRLHALGAACSFEQRALGAKLAGAAAWATALSVTSAIYPLDPVPGFTQEAWRHGDARQLDGIVAVDVRERQSALLVSNLEAGAALRLSLTPSPSPYRAVFASRGFRFWSVMVVLHSAAVFELGLCRSYAFVRADGGFRFSHQQAVLWVEIVACVLRAILFGIDPLGSAGLFDFATALSLVSAQYALSAFASALFLVLFCEAASAAGICSFRLANSKWQRAFLAVAFVALCADVAISRLAVSSGVFWLLPFKVAGTLAVVPLLLFCSMMAAYFRTRVGLASSHLSSGHAARWLRRMYQANMYMFLRLFTCFAAPWAVYGPVRQVVVFALGCHALNSAAYIHLDSVRPLFERSPIGPFRMLHDAFFAALSLAAEPSAPPLDETRLAAKANVQPSPRLYGKPQRRSAPVLPAERNTSTTTDLPTTQTTSRCSRATKSAGGLSCCTCSTSYSSPEERASIGRGSNGTTSVMNVLRGRSSSLSASSVQPVSTPGATGAAAPPPPGPLSARRGTPLSWRPNKPAALRTSGGSAGNEHSDSSSVPASPTRGGSRVPRRESSRFPPAAGGGAESLAAEPIGGGKLSESMLLGISLSGLRAFIDEHKIHAGAQTHEVQTLLRKMTQDTYCSYAETHHLPPDSAGAADGRDSRAASAEPPASASAPSGLTLRISKANVLVVHAHQRSFARLVDALEAHIEVHALDARTTFFWIDCFCVRAPHALDVASVMGQVARQVGSVLLCLEPWNRPVCLRRTWCLYELARAKAVGADVHVTVTKEARGEMRVGKKETILAAYEGTVDVRSSQSSVEKDKQMLLALVRQQAPDASGEEAFTRLNADVVQLLSTAVEALLAFAHKEVVLRPPLGSSLSAEAEELRLRTLAELEEEVNARVQALENARVMRSSSHSSRMSAMTPG